MLRGEKNGLLVHLFSWQTTIYSQNINEVKFKGNGLLHRVTGNQTSGGHARVGKNLLSTNRGKLELILA